MSVFVDANQDRKVIACGVAAASLIPDAPPGVAYLITRQRPRPFAQLEPVAVCYRAVTAAALAAQAVEVDPETGRPQWYVRVHRLPEEGAGERPARLTLVTREPIGNDYGYREPMALYRSDREAYAAYGEFNRERTITGRYRWTPRVFDVKIREPAPTYDVGERAQVKSEERAAYLDEVASGTTAPVASFAFPGAQIQKPESSGAP